MEVLPEGWHFLPKHPEKNIKYYRHILIQEGSAKVEDIMNKEDPSVVLYHKFNITSFVSCRDWGQHPSLLKTLTGLKSFTGSDLHYSYYDYINAFEKIAGKSSKELKDLAQQLLLQSEELQPQEKGSPASSEASANFDPNDPLFQDSQDPNDAYRLDSD
ncbi:hypothetical protein SO802_031446 [Lithocarpus litseifolius]|uniref:Uncharacterized protein n=1 Tax=Lithocarpus litseifolius TaxID=425828 RepID=A0AAW2BKI1_9ROSI